MSSLESRKLLLVAESELNRAQLIQEARMVTGEIHTLVHRAGIVGKVVAAATALMAVMASRRRVQPAAEAGKPSWLQTLLKGAGLASTLWTVWRRPARD